MKVFAGLVLFLLVFVGGVAAGLWCDRSDNAMAKKVVEFYESLLGSEGEASASGAADETPAEAKSVAGADEEEGKRQPPEAAAAADTPAKADSSGEAKGETAAKPKKVREEKGPWIGFWEENRILGKPVRARDFEGSVAFVCEWSADNAESVALLKRVDEIASSFRGKKLVVLASHRGDADRKTIKKAAGRFSFPVYADAGLDSVMRCAPTVPSVYVVDHLGRIMYRGRDDRRATEQLVNAITECQVAPASKGRLGGTGKSLK